MKKIFKSQNVLFNVRNFLFAFYLLVVSLSLPVLCFLQVSYPADKTDSKESVSNTATQDLMSAQQKAGNVVGLND